MSDVSTRLYEVTVGPFYVVENDFVCWLISIEDWDAMVASLGPGAAQSGGCAISGVPIELTHGGRPWIGGRALSSDTGCDARPGHTSLGPGSSSPGGFTVRPTAPPWRPADGDLPTPNSSGPTSLSERMDAERRHLERLGRNVAFWAIAGLVLVGSVGWILWR